VSESTNAIVFCKHCNAKMDFLKPMDETKSFRVICKTCWMGTVYHFEQFDIVDSKALYRSENMIYYDKLIKVIKT
jgi:hypothetical protein